MSDLLSRIVAKQLGNNADAQPQSTDGAVNPFIAGIMRQVGLTPEKIEEYVEPIKNNLQHISDCLDKIDTDNQTIIYKLGEVESNMVILMRDAEQDAETQRMIDNCAVIPITPME